MNLAESIGYGQADVAEQVGRAGGEPVLAVADRFSRAVARSRRWGWGAISRSDEALPLLGGEGQRSPGYGPLRGDADTLACAATPGLHYTRLIWQGSSVAGPRTDL